MSRAPSLHPPLVVLIPLRLPRYAMFYFFTKLEVTDPVSTIIYIGYSSLASLGFFFLTGTIGFYSTFYFVSRIYGAVKID